MSKFSDYNFSAATQRFLEINQFTEPTPIQQQVIPLVMKNKDVIGISDTGTGKTHAFLIPILERINPDLNEVQAVITAPTRELAMQLYARAQQISEACPKINVKLISGGLEKSRMSEQLKVQPQIVIGTPGRIRDLFLNEQTLRIEKASILVIDEADMTLEFGFLEDIDAIAGRMRKDLQMLSFSATIPQGLRPFLKKYMSNPVTVQIEDEHKSSPKIEQILIPCKHLSYEQKLLEILPGFTPYVCLIFANTRSQAASCAALMRENGYDLIELHGDLQPRERRSAMKNLMNLDKTYVVATDIAARGIDVEGVSHVISLGFPKELDFFIHRSGRTGRAGRDGTCFSLYKKEDEPLIKQLQVKGIGFKTKNYKNGEWVELKTFNTPKVKKDNPLDKEIAKVVSRKKAAVKPGYKKKRKAEVEKLKRRAHREMIQQDIKRQQKERAKKKQKERNEE
ncbi:DEAD/DEAH box helicase [Dielma fastidiosa]|uniref:DEAD/DEAH box helicase n=1 Tax=Dielma fastidiosa TaxID=1034346 RepID=UPI0023F14D32|nr:DEAD/DEAH box helicase [Dielma fastidiosa]